MSSTFSLENLQVKVASCYKQRHNIFPPWRCAMVQTRICGSGIVIVINEMFGNPVQIVFAQLPGKPNLQ